jgi:tRNA N6-adenosine threonylcarbamoyltransferase
MLVLGIESTCDETSCAIVKDGKHILSNVVFSQTDLHENFGGVVPELACRRHVDVLLPVLKKALSEAGAALADIDLIAVAHGPGLIGALLLGLNTAKSLSLALDIPFIGVNHIQAHLYAALMSQPDVQDFPYLGVVISGGHTALVKMHSFTRYELIGQTIDDALGEAFDKVAKILDVPYPGGPNIEKLALKGDPFAYPFKPSKIKDKEFDFSFSGLKTRVLYQVKGQNSSGNSQLLSLQDKQDIAASFQRAALGDVLDKTLSAASVHQIQHIVFGGGVSNNQCLRKMFADVRPDLVYYWPGLGLSLDNAAMIAGLGYHNFKERGEGDSLGLEAQTRIPFSPMNFS